MIRCPHCKSKFRGDPQYKGPGLWTCRCLGCKQGFMIDGSGEVIKETTNGGEEIHS